jgi:phosphoserine phosphatase RsbU/P
VKWFGTNTDIDEAKNALDELKQRAEFEEQLIGIVSHDLRNPLSAIGIAASMLLRRGNLDDHQGKAVARIVSSSERAARLIRDFLDFTQARSLGAIPIRPADANLREIARHVVDEVHLTFPERQASVEHHGAERGRWDADRISQVIGNLVSNAFQHSPPDAPVRVVSRGEEKQAVIEVRNQGPPIAADDLPRLFAPFQRGGGAKPTSGRSIGLGLYISGQIVAAHGGTIEVDSAEGRGTTFTVRLPWQVPAPSSLPTTTSSASW